MILRRSFIILPRLLLRCYSQKQQQTLLGQNYDVDEWSNVSDSIKSKMGRQLLHQKSHPLHQLALKIKHFFYTNYKNRSGLTPLFSVYDQLSPIVTLQQNFDSLLVPVDHVCRKKSDCFYVNKDLLLRAHTSAHQSELLRAGLNAFLVFGDVYRRDCIDATHYPVFHQCEGVRIFNSFQLFKNENDKFQIVNCGEDVKARTPEKQEFHTRDACIMAEIDLKKTLGDLAQFIFGQDNKLNMKWNETVFPFTHPSWELEIEYKGKWYEVLGCGVMEHKILTNAGAENHIGWAFGLGLERWSMILNDIPDIRIFWSTDSGFLTQFKDFEKDSAKTIKYKPVSVHPSSYFDISFWLSSKEEHANFCSNDFYDLVRDQGGDLVEQVEIIDEFVNKKTQRKSQAYRIVYRSTERPLTIKEINQLHKKIEQCTVQKFDVEIR